MKTVDIIEAGEFTISLEAELLYSVDYSLFFKLPDGAHDVSVNGVPTALTDGGFVGECPFTVTFEIPSVLLADHSFIEIYIVTPQGRKSFQRRSTIDYKIFEYGVQQIISTNEVIFHNPNSQHGGQPVYAIDLTGSNSDTDKNSNLFQGGINTVGGFSWVTTMYKGGMEDGGITLMPSPVDHDYDEYRIHHGMKWEGSWISFESSLGEFEIGLRVDGVPVSYLVQKHVLMEDVSYSSSGSGSGSSSTNVTGSSFSVISRFEEAAAKAQNSIFDGVFAPSGRYETQEDGSLIYWLSSDWLKTAGLFSADEDKGFLFVPLYQPETYPHTYDIELFFRYDEAGESKVLERDSSVTVRLDAPIMYKFTVEQLNGENVPNQDRAMTVYTNIRSSAERNRVLKGAFTFSYAIDMGNMNLFTVKAYFDKPEEVCNVYAVGDVPDDCPYYSFPLRYDENEGCWVGTGVLGEIMRYSDETVTDSFNVVYEYVSDQLDENGWPALRLNELEYSRNAMSVNGYNSVPEGYGVSELAPENGWTLPETYEKWQTFFSVLSTTSYYDLTDAQIRSFTDGNYRLYAPAAGLYNEEGVLVKVKQLCFAFTEEEYGEQAAEMTFNILDGAELNNQLLMGLACGGGEWKLTYHASDPGALLSLLTGCDNVPSRSGGTRWANMIKWTFTAAEKCADVAGNASSLSSFTDAITTPDWYDDLPEEGKELYDSYNTANTILTAAETVFGFIPHTGIPVFLLDNYLFGNYRNEFNENLRNMALSNRARKTPKKSNQNNPRVQHATVRKDPSGYVFEGYDGNRNEGVTATIYKYTGYISGWVFDDNGVLVSGTPDNTLWEKWDSEAFDEGPNPNITDVNGGYGWNVPTGAWKVVFEKDGCFAAESVVLGVPPEHLDVNISLLSYEAAELKAVTAYTSCIDFEFTKPVRVDDVLSKVSVLYNGVALFGTIEAINSGLTSFGNKQAESDNMTEAGLTAATRFRFTPFDLGDLIPGSTVRLAGEAGILTYSYLETAEFLSDYVLIPESDGDGGDPIRDLEYWGPESMETNESFDLDWYLSYVGVDGELTYEALTPDVAELSGTTVVPVSAGMAIFAVRANGATLPIVIDITETKVIYTVNVAAGENLNVSKPIITVLAGEAMEVIHVTAPDGYMIPADYSHSPVNGVSVERVSFNEIAVYGVPEANTEISIYAEPAELILPTVGYVRAELRERMEDDGLIDVRLIFKADMNGAKIRIDYPDAEPIFFGNADSDIEITALSVDMRVAGYDQVTVPIRSLFSIDDSEIVFTVVIVGFSKTADWEVTLKPTVRSTCGSSAPEPVNVRINYDLLNNNN